MTELSNKKICPEDVIRIILPASMIPDKATVSKVTGQNEYTLCHNLILYGKTPEQAIKVDGFFIVGDRGNINQVSPEQQLCWLITAEDFVETIKESWEPLPQ